MSDSQISREAIVSNTIEMMNADVPNMSNKTAIHKVFSAHFKRTDPDLYELFDAFFYCIIEAVCNQMESQGIKQPNMKDFIKAFRNINGISINIGNLKVHNYIPADFEERIIEQVMSRVEKKYIGNIVSSDGDDVEVELKDKDETESQKEDLEDDFSRYEDLVENIDEKELLGGEDDNNTGKTEQD